MLRVRSIRWKTCHVFSQKLRLVNRNTEKLRNEHLISIFIKVFDDFG